MPVPLIRAIILYIAVIACVRIMGKRQIGELQPSELVITILISEIAAIPMQDTDIPLINSIVPLLILTSLEIIISAINIKSQKFRNVMQGNSLVIIRNGILDQKQIKRLRFSVEDILEALRKKDIFNIEDVMYAIVETDGTISVMLKPENKPLTAKMLNITPKSEAMNFTVVDDGKIIYKQLADCNMNIDKLKKIIKNSGVKLKDILLMTANADGDINIIKKEKDL